MAKNTEVKNLAFLITFFSIVVIGLGTGLLWQDVVSTKITIMEYFPSEFGVTPSTDEFGAYVMSAFTSAVEIVALFVLLNKYFDSKYRVIAGVMYLVAFIFDSWTDVSMRSGWYKSEVSVQTAVAITFAFYTVGSELATSIAWLVLTYVGRKGWSEFLELITNIFVVAGSTGHEIQLLIKKSSRENERHISLHSGGTGQTTATQPFTPKNNSKPSTTTFSPPKLQQRNNGNDRKPASMPIPGPSYSNRQNENSPARRMGNIEKGVMDEDDFDAIVKKHGYDF
jgi:hypothetical protein